MTREYIDITPYLYANDIVETAFIEDGHLHLYLKLNKAKIIVTIISKHSTFRKEIERLLKEKDVGKEDSRKILTLVDEIHSIIHKDPWDPKLEQTVTNTKESESDLSDLSDQPKISDAEDQIKSVTISECLKLHSGKVQVIGNIVGVSEPYQMVSIVVRNCACGEHTKSFFPPIYGIYEDNGERKCPQCKMVYSIKDKLTKYRNAITVYLQDNEKFNDIEKLTCILLDIDIGSIRVGDRIRVTGEIFVRAKSNKSFLISKVFSEQIEYIDKENIELTERHIEAIERFARIKGPKVISALVDLFDRSVIGNNQAKEALLYSLVNAGDDLEDIRKKRPRKRIHTLLIGKPGLAKSSLLRKAISLIPNSRYESVQHSTSKSLTAIVSKEEEQYYLRLGPVSMSKGSICALNEAGTMSHDDQKLLLDVMEEGEYTINKYGFNSKIQSPTTIIMSANFKETNSIDINYISTDNIPFTKQVQDRIDLVIVYKDNDDLEGLKDYVQQKMKMHSKAVPVFDIFIKKYLERARQIHPSLSPEASMMIQDFYLNLRKSNPEFSDSRRKLDAIVRLCIAIAKLKLKKVVDGEDVLDATKFYNSILFTFNGSIAPIPKDPIAVCIDKCISFLEENRESSFSLSDLLSQVCSTDDYVMAYLIGSKGRQNGDPDMRKLSIDKNKKVRRISDLLRAERNVVTTNKNPIRLQFKEIELNISDPTGQIGQIGQIEDLSITGEPYN